MSCRTEPSPSGDPALPPSPAPVVTSSVPSPLPASRAAVAPAEVNAPPPPRDLPLAWSRLPLLPRRLRPRGWKAALSTWRTATTAYAKGDLRLASDRFMAVADQLSGSQRGAARRVRITGRCLAYENAGRSLVAARDDAAARALLEMAAEKDPDCQNSLALRISRIAREAPVTTSTSAP